MNRGIFSSSRGWSGVLVSMNRTCRKFSRIPRVRNERQTISRAVEEGLQTRTPWKDTNRYLGQVLTDTTRSHAMVRLRAGEGCQKNFRWLVQKSGTCESSFLDGLTIITLHYSPRLFGGLAHHNIAQPNVCVCIWCSSADAAVKRKRSDRKLEPILLATLVAEVMPDTPEGMQATTTL